MTLSRRLACAACCALLSVTLLVAAPCPQAQAIDFYELQIYTVETAPLGHFMLELHSNSVTDAYNHQTQLPLYQLHNTLELTYGLLSWLEVGQYLCTARLNAGTYEYAGGRTKVHFSLPQTEPWPIQFGVNIELQYMRREAVTDPFNIEVMPIIQGELKGFLLVANLSFEKQFSGPGTHAGVGFGPAGEITYRLHDRFAWLEPALEYYGDLGPLQAPAGLNQQQQFIVPSVNLYLTPPLELNLGVGVGVTHAYSGDFVKTTVGWIF
ncbi:MAG: hypothetical protein IVW56_10570 [Candidatus Binataceae bacterium]|nr:hypothetical protein [Candidatus Binataceae bacterium]